MLSNIIKFLRKRRLVVKQIPRATHGISRSQFNPNALKVLYRLHKAGYASYLVGGCIRDLLQGMQPKDFDIVTDAHPEQVKALFNNCRLIGRRFRLAHIHFGRDIIEVATFRAESSKEVVAKANGMIVRDNVYGTLEEDVMRRDFTINALYYNIKTFGIEDYVDGMRDLAAKRIVLIGDPIQRYREDPVRMLRAVRFAAKLDFTIAPSCVKPIAELKSLLAEVSNARLFEEYLKLFYTGHGLKTYKLLQHFKLFSQLFPNCNFSADDEKLTQLALADTDRRIGMKKTAAPGFLLAVFLWPEIQRRVIEEPLVPTADKLLRSLQRVIAMPRVVSNMARDIWEMQFRLSKRRPAKASAKLAALSKFRAGFDFLQLRANAGDTQAAQSARFWQKYYQTENA